MRLGRKRREDVAASISAAARARENANEQLAVARDVIAVQRERARRERETIITALKKMRQSNNLGALILDAVEKDVTGENPNQN